MSKSSLTCRKIIAAAVQQIAGEDIFHRLQLERIAEKAGVSEATIHYHFGRKDDFSKALWQSIVEEREPFTLAVFLEQNRLLLDNRAGQCEFVHRMIVHYCGFFRTPKSEYLRRLIRLFFIENIGLGKTPRAHVNEYFQKELGAFHQVCKTISGIDDRSQSALMFLFIMHPLSIAFTHMTHPSRTPLGLPREQYEAEVMKYAERELLFHLGLLVRLPLPAEDGSH